MSMTRQQNSSQDGNSTRDPWAAQAPYLQDAFTRASGLVNGNTPVQQQAGFNPNQLSTFQSMYDYANGNNTPQSTAAAGTNLTNSGVAAADMNNMSPQNVAWMNSRAANTYADGQNISDQTTAAMRDATRSVNEQALPSVARDAAVSGNTFSNRRALTEGVIQRGLAEKTADVSANLRGDAYRTGLQLAEQGRENGISNGINTAGLGLSTSNSALGQRAGLFNLANTAGAGQQAATQTGLDNTYAQGSAPWDNLMRYMGVVGGQQWGGTTTTHQTGNQSTTPGLFDWASLGVSAFNGGRGRNS